MNTTYEPNFLFPYGMPGYDIAKVVRNNRPTNSVPFSLMHYGTELYTECTPISFRVCQFFSIVRVVKVHAAYYDKEGVVEVRPL